MWENDNNCLKLQKILRKFEGQICKKKKHPINLEKFLE